MELTRKQRWAKTPGGFYSIQKTNARARNIPWEFTFESWWTLWEESGKWDQRGKAAHQYVMSRCNDTGPYSPTNCVIKSFSENSKENWKILGRCNGRILPRVHSARL